MVYLWAQEKRKWSKDVPSQRWIFWACKYGLSPEAQKNTYCSRFGARFHWSFPPLTKASLPTLHYMMSPGREISCYSVWPPAAPRIQPSGNPPLFDTASAFTQKYPYIKAQHSYCAHHCYHILLVVPADIYNHMSQFCKLFEEIEGGPAYMDVHLCFRLVNELVAVQYLFLYMK